MEITAVLYFLRKGVKLHFYSLGTIFEENIRGVQRGEIPWLWVSNRGEKHPCWHTILLAKSSVLYLLRPLTLERGCPTPDRHFSAVAEQADFAGCKLQKTRNLHSQAELDCAKLRLFGCSWHRKSCSCAERFSVSTGAQEVYKNPPQRSAPVSETTTVAPAIRYPTPAFPWILLCSLTRRNAPLFPSKDALYRPQIQNDTTGIHALGC